MGDAIFNKLDSLKCILFNNFKDRLMLTTFADLKSA